MGAHSTAEKPSQTQCSVWLWSGEEEAGRAPACGTSHGPCQPRSTGVGGLGQEAQSKTTCCQPRCTTPSESTCEVHKECTVHSVCAMQYTVYVLCSTQCMCYAVHSVCTMQYTVCVLCSTQCMYNAVHSVCTMQYTVYVQCSTQCMYYAVHSVCTMQYTVYVCTMHRLCYTGGICTTHVHVLLVL